MIKIIISLTLMVILNHSLFFGQNKDDENVLKKASKTPEIESDYKAVLSAPTAKVFEKYISDYLIGKNPGIEINYKIVLSTPMAETLKKHDPDFRILIKENFRRETTDTYHYKSYQTPSALIGDFNGDNLVDIVLMGYNKVQGEILAIVSNTLKSNLGDSENIQLDQIEIDPRSLSSFHRKKEIVMEEYKVIEIWISGGRWNFENGRPVDVDLILLLHHKGEIIKSKNPNRCSHTLTTDAFAVKNFDVKDKETLFPCGDMPMVVSCLIDR